MNGPWRKAREGWMRAVVWLVVVSALFASSYASALHPRLALLADSDTNCIVWVVFSERGPLPRPGREVAPSALVRRFRAHYPSPSDQDRPVRQEFLEAIRARGATLRNVFRWANAASFSLPSSHLREVASLPFVRAVFPVRTFRRTSPPFHCGLGKAFPEQLSTSFYGPAYRQLEMLNVPLAHEYIRKQSGGLPGTGVLIGFFDTGFRLVHPCYTHVRLSAAVIADSDFVAHDGDATMPTISHGAQTMGVVAAYAPRELVGVAWAARYVLARTENDESEQHVEEDNWAAALVWAESLGVDIVNSSLGYRYGFDAPDEDYTFEDMDGRTTIVARATQGALARGVIIVSSAGNDGALGMGSINSPGDAPDVVTVGAVDSTGEVTVFSSRGPTADGRVKPDVVAMGQDVVVIRDDYGYVRGSGTSFSAPLVAGVVALIRQCYPELSSKQIVERLYTSCRFTAFQDSVDNSYGRGIPDALAACMRPHEIFFLAEDSLATRVAGVVVETHDGVKLAECDSLGTAVVTLSENGLPLTLRARLPGGDTVVWNISSTPSAHRLRFAVKQHVRLELRDRSGYPVADALVETRTLSGFAYATWRTGTDGSVDMRFHTADPLMVTVRATGFLPVDTIQLHCSGSCTVRVVIERLENERLVIYPSVVRPGDCLTIEFVHARNAQAFPWVASVRTAAGVLVWRSQGITPLFQPLRLTYDCRNSGGSRLRPGTYVCVIECGGKTKMHKFVVIG